MRDGSRTATGGAEPDTGGSTDLPDRTLRDHLRRGLNVLVALVGIVVAAPLMLVIAALVKLTSPGPALYRQKRIGLDRRNGGAPDHILARRRKDFGGRIFTMYKFRTMTADADQAQQMWSSPEDPRVTRLGRILRKYRLDELPQLFNVLKGDMNIVGPRPEQPQIFVELKEKIREYPKRQKVLPGITGWAQVNQAYDQSIEDVKSKVDLDLQYLERRSPVEDLKIMARTIPVMIRKQGSL